MFARDAWGSGWARISAFQQNDTAAGELLLAIESMSDDVLVEQFGKGALEGLRVVKQMITAMQQELAK